MLNERFVDCLSSERDEMLATEANRVTDGVLSGECWDVKVDIISAT